MADGRAGWNEMAATYDRTRAFPGDGERDVPLALARLLRDLGARRVLDLGCGTGRFALPLARAGLRVVAADRSPEMLAMFASKEGREDVAIVRCDADALPFRGVFDAVVFSHFLHLVGSLEKLAAELERVLVPGARLVLVDTSSGLRPATLRVLELVMPPLFDRRPFAADPTGDDSRDARLFRTLLSHLRGDVTEVVPCGTYPATTSLREALDDVRARKWWTFRVLDPGAVARAADDAERALVGEGADLDARVPEAAVVRLVLGRTPVEERRPCA